MGARRTASDTNLAATGHGDCSGGQLVVKQDEIGSPQGKRRGREETDEVKVVRVEFPCQPLRRREASARDHHCQWGPGRRRPPQCVALPVAGEFLDRGVRGGSRRSVAKVENRQVGNDRELVAEERPGPRSPGCDQPVGNDRSKARASSRAITASDARYLRASTPLPSLNRLIAVFDRPWYGTAVDARAAENHGPARTNGIGVTRRRRPRSSPRSPRGTPVGTPFR